MTERRVRNTDMKRKIIDSCPQIMTFTSFSVNGIECYVGQVATCVCTVKLLVLLHLAPSLCPSQLLGQLRTRSQNHRDDVVEHGNLGCELTDESSVRCVGGVL